jgi:hypothetical protein
MNSGSGEGEIESKTTTPESAPRSPITALPVPEGSRKIIEQVIRGRGLTAGDRLFSMPTSTTSRPRLHAPRCGSAAAKTYAEKVINDEIAVINAAKRSPGIHGDLPMRLAAMG